MGEFCYPAGLHQLSNMLTRSSQSVITTIALRIEFLALCHDQADAAKVTKISFLRRKVIAKLEIRVGVETSPIIDPRGMPNLFHIEF